MGVIKAKWVENLSRKEKQKGGKKSKLIWSRPNFLPVTILTNRPGYKATLKISG